MTVLAVGDSISFGYELSDLPNTGSGIGNTYLDYSDGIEKPLYPSKLAYPELLANKLGVPCENLSLIGGSNDRIFRVAVDRALTQKYDLIICSWTSIDRFDFTYNKEDIGLSVRSSPFQVSKFPWLKSFIADYYNVNQMTHRFLSQSICLQALFNEMKQPYLFVNGTGLGFPGSLNLQNYVNQINQTKYPSWGTSLIEWCQEANLPFGPQGHFLEEGHQLVADRLFKKFQELYS